MPHWLRSVAATSVLSAALVFALLGVVSSGASVKAGGKVVSASLTKTSFTVAQAKTVKLVYKFSPASKHFGYLLSLKKGAKWVKVQSVNKKGSFKGTYRMTVKKLFGSKAVKVGQYRVEISADANSVTRTFKVVKTLLPPGAFDKTSLANGSTGEPASATLIWSDSSNATSYEYYIDTTNDNACSGSWTSAGSESSASPSGLVFNTPYYWHVRAKNARGTRYANNGSWFSFQTSAALAGHWSGITGSDSFRVSFFILTDQANVSHFTFFYAHACVTEGYTVDGIQRSIADNSFSGTNGDFIFSGTFDSPTTAHGTVGITNLYLGCPAPNEHWTAAGPYSWTATWQDASQPS
jgi:hypothetical protein